MAGMELHIELCIKFDKYFHLIESTCICPEISFQPRKHSIDSLWNAINVQAVAIIGPSQRHGRIEQRQQQKYKQPQHPFRVACPRVAPVHVQRPENGRSERGLDVQRVPAEVSEIGWRWKLSHGAQLFYS